MSPAVRSRPLHYVPGAIDDALSRRSLLAGAAAAAVLAGCSTAASPAPVATPGYPRTLTHAFGRTELPASPTRVAALGFADADNAAVLGVVPVARGDNGYPGIVRPWLADAVSAAGGDAAAVAEVPVYRDIGFEQVAALRPDLVLAGTANGLDRAAYDRLSAIAPTVTFETALYQDSWQQQLRLAARALAREERAEQVIAQVDGRFAAARREHPRLAGATLAFGTASPDGVGVVADIGFFILQIPRDLGLVVAPRLVELAGPAPVANLSPEQLELLDADVLVIVTQDAGERAALEARPLFSRIPAVREGRYLPLDGDVANALSTPSPLSIPYALDRVLPALTRIVG